MEALYQYAKFQFECGNYSLAADLLQPYRTLCTSGERNMSALWGKLASDILMQNFEAAREDINKLRDAIDNQTFAPPLMQLQQRTWLLHWSLYVFWNHENGKNDLLDLFLSPPYLAAIQINAQHLLRYMAAAFVVNKRKRHVLKELIRWGGEGTEAGARTHAPPRLRAPRSQACTGALLRPVRVPHSRLLQHALPPPPWLRRAGQSSKRRTSTRTR